MATSQGSCLGPLLFLIFNNYLHRAIENCKDIQFADDWFEAPRDQVTVKAILRA